MELPRCTRSKIKHMKRNLIATGLSLFAGMAALMCPVIPALSANPDSNVTRTDVEVLGYGEK
jgi:hypothetical protein